MPSELIYPLRTSVGAPDGPNSAAIAGGQHGAARAATRARATAPFLRYAPPRSALAAGGGAALAQATGATRCGSRSQILRDEAKRGLSLVQRQAAPLPRHVNTTHGGSAWSLSHLGRAHASGERDLR